MDFDFSRQPGMKNNGCEVIKLEPLISIITPFFNAAKYFEQTFNCVINQTFIWFEWIIVDDGSTRSEDIKLLEQLVQRDSRIHLFRQENKGPASARNYAVSKTNTDLIVSLDADDLIEPVYLEETFFALYFNPGAAWAYTDSLGFEQMEYVWKVPFDSEKLKKRNFLIEIGTFRKTIFHMAGGYDEAQKYSHEDWNLWLRLMTKGGYPVHISSLSSWYRIVDNGALHRTNDNKQRKKVAYQRVKEIASQIGEKIEAVEYPRASYNDALRLPGQFEWSLEKRKEKIEILFLLPFLECKDTESIAFEIIKYVNTQRFHVAIMTTQDSINCFKQKYSEYVDDLFELPAFLDDADYPEFISYYIQSRKVDIVIICGSMFGYYALPWLSKKFPGLYIVDCLGTNGIKNLRFTEKYSDNFKGLLNATYCFNDDRLEKDIKTMIHDLENLIRGREKATVNDEKDYTYLAENYLTFYNVQHAMQNEIDELQKKTKKIKYWYDSLQKIIKKWKY